MDFRLCTVTWKGNLDLCSHKPQSYYIMCVIKAGRAQQRGGGASTYFQLDSVINILISYVFHHIKIK